jgi:hypothetical protein
MRLPFYLVVVKIFAGLAISFSGPLRWLSVDRANILVVGATCENEDNPQV